MRYPVRTMLVLACALLAAAPALPQAGPDHESEQTDSTFPLLPLEAAIFDFPNEDLQAAALRIQLGIATMPERRWFYRAADRFAPFEGQPAPDWKLQADLAGEALDVAADDTIYTWSSIGPNGNYDVSLQTGGPGARAQGRATAVWTHVEGPTTVNKRVLYVGFADGGVWKTVDAGAHWTPLTDFQPTLSIGALDVLPGQDLVHYSDATVYVGTGEGNFSAVDKDGVGVLKSTDGGATWTVQALPWREDVRGIPGLHRIRRLRIDRSVPNAQSVWVAGDGGVYHTADGGQTWSLITGLPHSGAPAGSAFPGGCWSEFATDFVIDEQDRPLGHSTLFAAFGRRNDATCVTPNNEARKNNGVYRSVDGGATWTKITPSGANGWPETPGLVGRIALLSAPSNPKHLYALIARFDNGNVLGIFDTLDGTAPAVQWNAGATTNFASGQGWYNLTGAVHPTDENTLIVGGLDNYLSRNRGVTLTRISGWADGSSVTWSHADHHHAVWADGTTYYDANDGGIFFGTIGANNADWDDRNGDILSTLQFYGLSQSASDPYKINAGLQDNGHAFFDGTTWRETYGGDGGFACTDQRDDSQAYEEYVYASIRHSDDGGQTWPLEKCMQNFGGCTVNCGLVVGCIPDNHTAFIAWYTLDVHNQDVMYVGTSYLYRNVAASAASPVWARIASDGANGDFIHGATSGRAYINFIHTTKASPVGGVPAMSQIIYLGTSTGRVWRTTDGGLTWADLTKAPLPADTLTTGRVVTSIDTDPNDANKIIVTYSGFNASTNPPLLGHVFRSLDGGATWTDVSGALPDEPFNTVAVNPNPGETDEVYVASDTGVYVNTAGWSGTTWRRINNGMLPHVSVNMLQFTNATTPKRLRAATHGRGIWEMVKTFDPVLSLDRASYGCDDAVKVSLQTALVGAGQQTVAVASGAEPAETLVLLETPPGSGLYTATLRTSGAAPAAGDGRISVFNADRLTVRWQHLAAAAVADCSECATPPSPATGANVRIEAGSVTTSVDGGDGDEFLDNCETGRVRFTVKNAGDRNLTNLRVSGVAASNPNVKLPRLPVAIAGSVASCSTAQGVLSVTAQGLGPGEVLELAIEVTSDELAAAGIARAFTVRFGEAEQDFQLAASKTWTFEQGLDGWRSVRGAFAHATTGGGANLSGGYVASSELADNACDEIQSPVFRLTPTSTLSLYNQFTIEPIGPTTDPGTSWFDRANVALFDAADGSRMPVVPSGGRTYPASGPGGACVTGGEPGWAGPGPGWLQSTWTAADLGAVDRAGRPLRLDVGYATDTSAALTGFWFDDVTLTNVELLAADGQGDVCRSCGDLDDADAAVEYTGGWHRKSDAAATGGAYSRRTGNNKNGAAARLVFDARDVTYLYGLTPSGGTADLYLDGVKIQTVNYGGTASFGKAVTFSNLGPGQHELKIVHVSGTVIVDGFRLDCAAGSGANAAAVEYRSQTETSTGSASEGPLLVRTVEVKPGDVAVSVLVEGAPAPLTVRLLDPSGTLLSTGGALISGLSASGLDAAATTAGRYRLEIVNTLPLGGKVSISVARTVRVP